MGFIERLRATLERLPEPQPPPAVALPESPLDTARYAFEIRLSRLRDREISLTRAGRVFLSLPGRDAVAWLLALEIAQAQSDQDPFRLSAAAAKEILAADRWFIAYDSQPSDSPPAIHESRVRLDALGVISTRQEDRRVPHFEEGEITAEGRVILQDLLREGESRWSPLAAACIAEEQESVLEDFSPAVQRLQHEGAAEASAREARLVAHEVRNALGPVRFALNRLLTVVGDADAQRQLARVEEGVTRLFRFVEDRLRMAEVIDRTGESFELDAALGDLPALETLVKVALSAGDASVRGPRSSVLIALAELVRNAHLANGGRAVRVCMTTERRNGHVTLLVDDDGAGVASADRERVFQRGVSLRGGGGEGLALAKDVFERAMGGTIRCMDSPLGGARFEIVLPTVSTRSRPAR